MKQKNVSYYTQFTLQKSRARVQQFILFAWLHLMSTLVVQFSVFNYVPYSMYLIGCIVQAIALEHLREFLLRCKYVPQYHQLLDLLAPH